MLETGVAGNDRRAGPHRDRQSADRICRVEKAGDRQGIQSPAVSDYTNCRAWGIGQRSSIPKPALIT